jgi:hypothetical protein
MQSCLSLRTAGGHKKTEDLFGRCSLKVNETRPCRLAAEDCRGREDRQQNSLQIGLKATSSSGGFVIALSFVLAWTNMQAVLLMKLRIETALLFLCFTSFHATHKSTRFDSGPLCQFFVFLVAKLQKKPLVCACGVNKQH